MANEGPAISGRAAVDRRTRPETVGSLHRSTRLAASVVTFVLITTCIFFLVEGVASSVIFLKHVWDEQVRPSVAEQRHTRYDEELGWVSIPDLRIRDMYGEGKELITNNRGFRSEVETRVTPPAGKRRIICSGDSFTLGYGVSNDDSWCAQLAAMDSSLESVNMGQGGYGVDQAFLWYRRDGADLKRAVHVFAFIGDDFFRMQRDHFLGFSKPILGLEGERLFVMNTPVPRRNHVVRWLALNKPLFRKLSSVRLLEAIKFRLFGAWSSDENRDEANENRNEADETWKIATAVFDSLATENAALGSQFVLLFLPAPWDYATDVYDDWRRRAHDFSKKTGVPLIDMVEELRALKKDEASSMFIPSGEEGARHLNEAGNRWVARHLLDWGLVPAAREPGLNSLIGTRSHEDMGQRDSERTDESRAENP